MNKPPPQLINAPVVPCEECISDPRNFLAHEGTETKFFFCERCGVAAAVTPSAGRSHFKWSIASPLTKAEFYVWTNAHHARYLDAVRKMQGDSGDAHH